MGLKGVRYNTVDLGDVWKQSNDSDTSLTQLIPHHTPDYLRVVSVLCPLRVLQGIFRLICLIVIVSIAVSYRTPTSTGYV